MQVRSLGQEYSLEEGMVTNSSILAWRIPWTEAWWATVHRVSKSRTRLKQFSAQAHTSLCIDISEMKADDVRH